MARMAEELNSSLEHSPTWIVAVIFSIIVFIYLHPALHELGRIDTSNCFSFLLTVLLAIGYTIPYIYEWFSILREAPTPNHLFSY